eukprot:Gb_18780 [translate_table: standard]
MGRLVAVLPDFLASHKFWLFGLRLHAMALLTLSLWPCDPTTTPLMAHIRLFCFSARAMFTSPTTFIFLLALLLLATVHLQRHASSLSANVLPFPLNFSLERPSRFFCLAHLLSTMLQRWFFCLVLFSWVH